MDLSFSLDENGNSNPFKVPPAPITTSTPRKKPQKPSKFTCQHCGKGYQVKFYYDKHVNSHTSADTSLTTQGTADINNVSNAVHIDTSDLSFRQLQSNNDSSGAFKLPAVPGKKKKVIPVKVVKKPSFICTYCLKGYVCNRSFKMHIRAHYIQSASARFPDKDKIMENCEEIADKAMLAVSKCISVGDSGQNFKHLVGHIASIAANVEWRAFTHNLCSELADSIKDKQCVLPSALVTHLIDKVESINASVEKSNALLEFLNISNMFDANVLSQFLLEFSLNFMTEIMKFICQTFRNSLPQSQQTLSNVTELDKEDRQIIYYIAGSIMRGYLKIARRAAKSVTWQSVASVIRTNILIDKPSGDIDADSEWTMDVDRGNLLYVRDEIQIFFISLTKIVYASEERDGSINYESVITKVTNSSLSVDWGNIISDSLPEKVALNLMNDVVLCFSRTCGRGFAKKRLNFLRNRPMVSMPTRHLVASRKNR